MILFKKVKEIKSKEGVIHFRRWAIIQTERFSIYLHGIYKEDQDQHLHDHPWNFINIVLYGSYLEKVKYKKEPNVRNPGNLVKRNGKDFHKIEKLLSPKIYTLMITGPRYRDWGYDVNGTWVDQESYRFKKNTNQL
jgi:hypothetical protein